MVDEPAEPGAAPGVLSRYTLECKLGQGALGSVHAAWDPQLERRVAIKLLRSVGREGLRARRVARFLREAQALARLADPHIVELYDFGHYPLGSGELGIYLVMELVEGSTLREWLARPRSVAEVVRVFVDAGRGLSAAHEAGLVHRDFKPTNVMVTPEGRVKLLDFGLARVLADRSESPAALDPAELEPPPRTGRITETGAVMGTPKYMAPEQFERAHVGPKADQFSFCQAFLEALRGGDVFRATSYEEAAWAKRYGRICPAPSRDRTPRRLDRILRRGLSPSPFDRWPSMAALIAAVVRRRRPWRTAAAGAIAVGGVVALAPWVNDGTTCADGAGALDRAWSAERREAVRESLLRGAPTHGRFVWAEVESVLDERVADWSAVYRRSCEQFGTDALDEGAFDRRLSCLRDAQRATMATLELLSAADASVAEYAVEAAVSVPRGGDCETLQDHGRPLPGDEAMDEAVVAARRELARARIQTRAADLAKAAATLRGIDGLKALQFEPLALEVQAARALLAHERGSIGEAEEAFRDVVDAADGIGYTELAASAATSLARIVAVDTASHERGVEDLRRAQALVERLGRPLDLHVDVLRASAAIDRSRSDLVSGEAHLRDAIETLRAAGERDLALADTLVELGDNLGDQARLEEAFASVQEALSIFERIVGPEHPRGAAALVALAHLHERGGDPMLAVEILERARTILERGYGPAHVRVADVSVRLAAQRIELRRFDAASDALDRANEIYGATYEPTHVAFAEVLMQRGILAFRAAEWEAAAKLLSDAVDLYAQARGADSVEVAKTLIWLGRSSKGAPRVEAHRRALEILQMRFGPDHPSLVEPHIRLGHSLVRDREAARAQFEEALRIATESKPPSPYAEARARYGLARIAMAQDRTEDAKRELRRVLEWAKHGRPPWPLSEGATRKLAKILMEEGKRDEAVVVLKEEQARLQATGAPANMADYVNGLLTRAGGAETVSSRRTAK